MLLRPQVGVRSVVKRPTARVLIFLKTQRTRESWTADLTAPASDQQPHGRARERVSLPPGTFFPGELLPGASFQMLIGENKAGVVITPSRPCRHGAQS